MDEYPEYNFLQQQEACDGSERSGEERKRKWERRMRRKTQKDKGSMAHKKR